MRTIEQPQDTFSSLLGTLLKKHKNIYINSYCHVFSVVRHSRMYFPKQHRAGYLGLGRTGGFKKGQKSPHKHGGRSPHREDLLVGRKRDGFGMIVIVVVVEYYYFLIIIIVGNPRPRRIALVVVPCLFFSKILFSPAFRHDSQIRCFVVVIAP